jgi:hypothetical protein
MAKTSKILQKQASQRQKSYMQRIAEMGYIKVQFFINRETAQLFDELIANEIGNTPMSKQKAKEILMSKALSALRGGMSDVRNDDILAVENADLRKKLADLEQELKESKEKTEPKKIIQSVELVFDLEKAKQIAIDLRNQYSIRDMSASRISEILATEYGLGSKTGTPLSKDQINGWLKRT